MSPKTNKKFILKLIPRLLVVFAVIAVLYIYQNGGFSGFGRSCFEFKPEAVLDKKISETGKITYKSGRIQTFENNYATHEKRTFSNNILFLEGKADGDFDPVLKPLIKSYTYSQKIDTSASFCPENFVPHYPSALRSFIYFMPRTALFDGQTWEVASCGGQFLCSYSASMKDDENKINLGCSGSIGKTQTTISGTIEINENFDGFSNIKMTIVCENNDLSSTWDFEEDNSASSKIIQ